MAETAVVAMTAADGPLTGALVSVFRRAGWEVAVLGPDDPGARIRQVHSQRGRVDAWIYVPPSPGAAESGSLVSHNPVAILEEGGRTVRDVVRSQLRGGAVAVYVSLEAVSAGTESPRAASVHAALLGTARALGIAWAQESVRVNAILAPLGRAFERVHPTRYPLRRLATLDDLAWPAVFLVSHESSYVTAEALRVDGGFLCHQYF